MTEKLDKPQHKPDLTRTAPEAIASGKQAVVLREDVPKVGKAGERVSLDAGEASALRAAGKARRLRIEDLSKAD